jgi:transcription-repair coupling factor (superfamily II helicase)
VQHLFDGAPVAGILIGDLSDGFWIESDNIAFLTEAEIFNRTGKVRRKHAVSGSISDALLVESLTRGDFVVHEDHGIGRYMGLVREKINGGLVDCIQLDYADGDRLKFPVSDLRKIEKLSRTCTSRELELGKAQRTSQETRHQDCTGTGSVVCKTRADRRLCISSGFPHAKGIRRRVRI